MPLHQAPELPIELQPFGRELQIGVRNVQTTLRSVAQFDVFEAKTDPETHFQLIDGLEALQRFQGMLSVRSVLERPTATLHSRAYPRNRLVDGALHAIGASPELSLDAQLKLTEVWAHAAATGPGRAFPLRGIARCLAPQILGEATEQFGIEGAYRNKIEGLINRLDDQTAQGRLFKRFGGAQLKGFNN